MCLFIIFKTVSAPLIISKAKMHIIFQGQTHRQDALKTVDDMKYANGEVQIAIEKFQELDNRLLIKATD